MPKLTISNDEFASAVIASRLPGKSLRAFFEALTSPGPKEKHAGWTRVCENIREAKNLPKTSKNWRKAAHEIFLENIAAIEYRVWSKIMHIPVDADDTTDVYSALNSALSKYSQMNEETPSDKQ